MKMKVKMLVAQLCPTLCDPMDCSPPGSSVHGILQARILEWVAISSSRESSQPRDWIWVSCIADGFFTFWATREVQGHHEFNGKKMVDVSQFILVINFICAQVVTYFQWGDFSVWLLIPFEIVILIFDSFLAFWNDKLFQASFINIFFSRSRIGQFLRISNLFYWEIWRWKSGVQNMLIATELGIISSLWGLSPSNKDQTHSPCNRSAES